MAKVYPNIPSISTSSNPASEREKFTVWMKSLVFHGHGCTVFDSKGGVAFRVDNYQQRSSSRVFLMDSSGKVLFSIKRKKLGIFGCWDGFKGINESNVQKDVPWFRVRRSILSKDMCCRITLNDCDNPRCYYKVTGSQGKSKLKIVDFSGQILAEATQKQSSEGVPLGEDVLTLMVESQADQSLIMALVTVYGLISNKL